MPGTARRLASPFDQVYDSSENLSSRCGDYCDPQQFFLALIGEGGCSWKRPRLNRSVPVEKLQIIAEYFQFLREQKKWWMFPLAILVLLMGLLVTLTKGSPLAPFIYTIF
jgi:hypothetical protein